MEVYKQGEAKMVRRIAFYGVLALLIWGFKELSKWLTGFSWGRTELIGGFHLPYYEQTITVAVLISIVLNVVLAVWIFRLMNGPKVAPVLVDTETELKKVAWPTWADCRQSTMIVLVFVVLTAGFLTIVEVVLKKVFDLILV